MIEWKIFVYISSNENKLFFVGLLLFFFFFFKYIVALQLSDFVVDIFVLTVLKISTFIRLGKDLFPAQQPGLTLSQSVSS